MKVLLINPPSSVEERYGKSLGRLGPTTPPLGLAYIAAVLEKRGDDVEILDAPALNFTCDDIMAHFSKKSYDIVGISILTPTYAQSVQVIRNIRRANSNVKIIVGGAHPTIMPREVLEENPEIDFVVISEGEFTIVELLNTLEKKESPSQVKGIASQIDGKVRITEPRPFIKDLDVIPIPAFELLPMERYTPTASCYRNLPGYFLITSRGCPFGCTFCFHTFGRTYRFYSVNRIIEEMELLIIKYGAKEIMFSDDTFTINKARVEELCKGLIRQGIYKKIKWSCAARVDCVDKTLLHLMKESGCWQIHYGVESGSQRLLDIIQKGFTIEQVINAFKWTKQERINVRAFFMLGLPSETKEESLKTIEFAKKLDPDWAQFTVTVPYPGTKLHSQAKENGTLKSTKWEEYQTWGGWADTKLVYVPEGRNEEELKALQRLALRSFYLRPRILLRHLKSLNSGALLKKYINGARCLLFRD
ncbi:cobalamin-dependent protein [candidate division WOR-3 bacterium]|nr:cobalamin-dependent protein [candidate division WOR-3 bacterium]